MARRFGIILSVSVNKAKGTGFQVILFADEPVAEQIASWRVWKLIPVKVEGASTPLQLLSEILGSCSPPLYDDDKTG